LCRSASHKATCSMAGTDASTDAPPAIRRKHVTTAFVENDNGDVLLVLRSAKVGTYQHKYGAVSGGVEPYDASLAARAEQEVRMWGAVARGKGGEPWGRGEESSNCH